MKPCFDHNHLTFEEFGVYSYVRAVSHKSHVFYSDGRQLAAEFEGEGKNPAYRVINNLVKKGWLVLIKEGGRTRFGTISPNQYEAVDHETWAAAHPGQCQQPVPKRGQVPVPKERFTSPRTGNNLSQNQEQPVPERGHRFVKKEQKRKEREKDRFAPVPEPGQVTPESQNQNRSLSSTPAGPKPSTEKTMEDHVNYIIATAQKQNSAAAFSGGSNRKLVDALRKIERLNYAELNEVIRKTLSGCDEYMLRNFGSRLAAQLVGAVNALRAKRKEAAERREEARPREDWNRYRKNAVSDCDVNLDDWFKENPPTNGLGGEYELGVAKRERETILADRERWFETWRHHLHHDADAGWKWWTAERKVHLSRPADCIGFNCRSAEDQVASDHKKELERRKPGLQESAAGSKTLVPVGK